ncbi:hypothetical protein AAVH_28750 [Aphelenchoides avenae]|nr:hypothetical protein AAVH_28750 [Aphelenchus avenae]
MSVTPKSAGRLADANVKRIMGAIGEAETLRADVTCTRDIEALLPYFPPHVGSFEMVLSPSCALNDDASLDLLLYFANRMDFDDFVIKRYGSDVLELVTRTAKKFSCGFAGVLDVLVVPTYMPPLTQNAETTIAVNIRRPDGRRFLAVGEGRGMRMIIGDDRAVNERMSGRKDYNALRPLMNRGSTEFDQLRQAVYETSLRELLHDLRTDSDINGEQAARRFGYKSFTDFLRSAEMKATVNITKSSSGTTVYEAIPTADQMRFRLEQQKSAVNVAERYLAHVRPTFRHRRLDLRRRQGTKQATLARRCANSNDAYTMYPTSNDVCENWNFLQRDDTIQQVRAELAETKSELAEAESKIECFCCKDRPIEVVFNCGHGACQVCTERLTTEERPAPSTNRFSADGPKARVRKVDPKCSQCGEPLDPCVKFYSFRS